MQPKFCIVQFSNAIPTTRNDAHSVRHGKDSNVKEVKQKELIPISQQKTISFSFEALSAITRKESRSHQP